MNDELGMGASTRDSTNAPLNVRKVFRTLLSILLFAFASKIAAAELAVSSKYVEPFPVAASKKGLQVQMVDDAIALGVKHAAINVRLSMLYDVHGNEQNPAWRFEGRTFRFQQRYLESLDQTIKALSAPPMSAGASSGSAAPDAGHGALVYLILTTGESADPELNRVALHPSYDKACPNHLSEFNTVTDDGRRWFAACLEFMAERWSRPDRQHGRVVGYILGNEVNSHWFWANMGRATMEEFADDYLRCARLACECIRRQSSSARVYLSLEHHWNIRYPGGDVHQAFAGRPMLEYFAKRAKEQGDFDWHLAFHPYPENLGDPRFWNDKTATAQTDTPRITFKNVELLPTFMRQTAMLYAGQPRRIILSEQGFNTPAGPDGEAIQAAAYCNAFKKIEKLDGIDAFILHRHVDSSGEGGLALGLWTRSPAGSNTPLAKKQIYNCFRAADTPEWRQAFEFALPIVGLKNWDVAR